MSNLRGSSKVFRLSDEQYQAMSGYFTKYDQDLDGELNFKELKDLVRGVGHYQDGTDLETNARTLMSKLDTGGNGTLGFNEFLRGYERMLANAGSDMANLDILHVTVSEKEKAAKAAAEKARREAEDLAAKEAAEGAAAENAKIELKTSNQASFSAVAPQEKPKEVLSINQNETTFDDDLELDDSETTTGKKRNQANQSRELSTDIGTSRDLDTAQAEKISSQRAAAAQAAVEKASADKAAADKAASEKAAADKAAADKAASEKAAADKAAAQKLASDRANAQKEAAERALAEKAAAEKAANERAEREAKEASERSRRNVVILEWPYGGTVVLVGGTFNNWELVPMTQVSGNLWRYEVYDVPPTTSLLYKFHVDGFWSEDQQKPIDNNERIDGWPVINNQIYA